MRRVKQGISKPEYIPNLSFDIKKSRTTVRDTVAELSCTQDSKKRKIIVSTDITLLFSQERLENRLSVDELRQLVNRYSPNRSVYLHQLSDDALLSTLKSKHIQSLSELRSWTEYCLEEFASELESLNAPVEEVVEQPVVESPKSE